MPTLFDSILRRGILRLYKQLRSILSTPINTNIKGRCDTGKHADQTINCRHELRFAQRNDEHLESDDTAKGKQNC